MKNRLNAFAAILAIAAFSQVSHAQTKIGVIAMNGAIANTSEGKKAIADLQKKFQPRQQELERLQGEINAIQDKLNKQGPTLSEEEQRRMARDLEDKQKQLKRSSDDAQVDFNADRDEAVRRIGQKMVQVIGAYAQESGFTLVVDGAQIPIYYASKDLDITAEIIKRYDAANPVDSGAAPAPPKPAAKPTTPPAGTKPK